MSDVTDEILCQRLCNCKTVLDGKKRFLMALRLLLSLYADDEEEGEADETDN